MHHLDVLPKVIFSRQRCPGFSLVELLIAVSLLSVVLIGGFTAFNMIEATYLREAGYARKSRTIGIEADRLFLAIQDNTSFSAHTVSSWPQSGEAPGLLSVTPLWDNASMLNRHGGFICRVSAIDLPAASFRIPVGCLEHSGISENAFSGLIGIDLPGVLIMDAQEGCILSGVERTGTTLTFTVLRDTCLRSSTGDAIHTSAIHGSGVIFPRYLIQATNMNSAYTNAFFEHPGKINAGAGLYFGQNSSRDGSLFTISSSLPGDDFTQAWVNIHQFGNHRALKLIHPDQLTSFTLKLDVLSPDGQVATSISGSVAARRLYQEFNTSSALVNFLHQLHLRSTTTPVVLRLHLGAGTSVWVRDLELAVR